MRIIRIGGRVFKLQYDHFKRTGFGIIIGDDDRHYMFLPSYLRDPLLFMPQLTLGSKVDFHPEDHPRGLRARNIDVLEIATEVSHGEAVRH